MKRFLLALASSFLLFPAISSADYLQPVSYPDGSRYSCSTAPIKVYPGQNLNLLRFVATCPNAKKISGSGPASPEGSGYITRFAPGMVELLRGGKTRTPRVDDLHLHHAVWLKGGSQPYFAVGEEKTIVSLPEGYGVPVNASDTWGFNYMIHSLRATSGRKVRVLWQIDWVPAAASLKDTRVRWLDVAGAPQVYPVFDAERKFDLDADGKFVFPDDASSPSHEEHDKISPSREWTIGEDTTLVFAAGHLHPGGLYNDLWVQRGSEVRNIFRSDAHFFSPQTAVSWDISMEATPRSWRVNLQAGDRVFTDVTYDVSKASWYEAMGIVPLAFSQGHDPSGVDPFAGNVSPDGVLTHGRLKENIDINAGGATGLTSPARLKIGKRYPARVSIRSFLYSPGGFSAQRGFPASMMRPPLVSSPLEFKNYDALAAMTQEEQAWHTITSCKLPCTRGSGIGYPLADGRFDSGQLGYGQTNLSGLFSGSYGYLNGEVTTASSTWQTPDLAKGTYAYFCRIHPFMRGSFKVAN